MCTCACVCACIYECIIMNNIDDIFNCSESGNIMFVDSSGGMDIPGTRVFLLVTKTAFGTIPLGVL